MGKPKEHDKLPDGRDAKLSVVRAETACQDEKSELRVPAPNVMARLGGRHGFVPPPGPAGPLAAKSKGVEFCLCQVETQPHRSVAYSGQVGFFLPGDDMPNAIAGNRIAVGAGEPWDRLPPLVQNFHAQPSLGRRIVEYQIPTLKGQRLRG